MMTKVIKALLLVVLLLPLEQLTKGMKYKLLIVQIRKINVKTAANRLFDHHHNTRSMVSN